MVATTTKRIFLHTVPCKHLKTFMMNIVELIKKALRFGQTTPVYPTCCRTSQWGPSPSLSENVALQKNTIHDRNKYNIIIYIYIYTHTYWYIHVPPRALQVWPAESAVLVARFWDKSYLGLHKRNTSRCLLAAPPSKTEESKGLNIPELLSSLQPLHMG